MTEEIRRTFPKKPAPGTPFKSPIPKFKRDQEKWNKERREMMRTEKKQEYSSQKQMESNSGGGRYFEAAQKTEERKQLIEERRANKKLLKGEARKAKMELKMTKRQVNKMEKKEKNIKIDKANVDKKKKTMNKLKKQNPSVPTEESDDPESDVEHEVKVKKITSANERVNAKGGPHFGESDIDSDDLPGEDMFGNEKEEMEVDGDESEDEEINQVEEMGKGEDEEDEDDDDEETVPLASSKNKYMKDEMEYDEEEDEDEQDADEEEEEDDPEEDMRPAPTDIEKFREEMAFLPLSKVREVKEKLGIKLFNDAFFGRDEKNEEEKAVEAAPWKKVFKRENSKRPREVSSKRGASRFRPIYNEKKTKTRLDPRFDDKCGAFNEVIYDTNYGFLDEMRSEEVKKMKKDVLKAKREGDSERVATLREEIIREENRQKAKREKEMRMNTMKELKKENMERMKKGLQPKFVKRSEVKMKIMEKKFEQLKEDNQLDKYLRRKSKKESRKGSSGKGGGPKLGIGH